MYLSLECGPCLFNLLVSKLIVDVAHYITLVLSESGLRKPPCLLWQDVRLYRRLSKHREIWLITQAASLS
jgi:hypothetical protein